MAFKFTRRDLHILVIEDNEDYAINLKLRLEQFGRVDVTHDSVSGSKALLENKYDMAFIDLDLEYKLAGIELIKLAYERSIFGVVLTGHDEDECLASCYKVGAKDFLLKSAPMSAVEIMVKSFLLNNSDIDFDHMIRQTFITQDEATISELRVLKNIALTDCSVLIQGPTGVGKSLVAKLIHQLRYFTDPNDKFIAFSCSEMSESLLESDLFGHVKGAFTGAHADKIGKLKLAHGGTLFIDEVGKMPLSIQDKLIKVIEEKQFYPLGSEKKNHSKFRLVTAACENMEELIKAGKLRADFYYRIRGASIHLKGFKDRSSDIPILLKHIQSKSETGRKMMIDPDVMKKLMSYEWPGNFREMQYIFGMWSAKGIWKITKEDLPVEMVSSGEHPKQEQEREGIFSVNKESINFIQERGLHDFIDLIEERVTSRLYSLNGSKARETIRSLGVSNDKFYKIIKRTKKRSEHELTC